MANSQTGSLDKSKQDIDSLLKFHLKTKPLSTKEWKNEKESESRAISDKIQNINIENAENSIKELLNDLERLQDLKLGIINTRIKGGIKPIGSEHETGAVIRDTSLQDTLQDTLT